MENSKKESELTYSWEWPAVFGILLIVLGAIIISVPVFVSIGISWLMGLAFVVGGVGQLIHAFRFARSPGWAGRFLMASLSIVAGIILFRSPILGDIGITLILAFYLLTSAIARGVIAVEATRITGRGWLIFSAFVSFGLGLYLLATFPVSSLIIPGTLLGIDLVFYGISLVAISGSFRRERLFIEPTEFRRVS